MARDPRLSSSMWLHGGDKPDRLRFGYRPDSIFPAGDEHPDLGAPGTEREQFATALVDAILGEQP